MSQQQVQNLLERNNKLWYTSRFINKKLGFTNSASNLSRLIKQGVVEVQSFKLNGKRIYIYRWIN